MPVGTKDKLTPFIFVSFKRTGNAFDSIIVDDPVQELGRSVTEDLLDALRFSLKSELPPAPKVEQRVVGSAPVSASHRIKQAPGMAWRSWCCHYRLRGCFCLVEEAEYGTW